MRYAHTNIIAKDWRAVSAFYQKVFGCKPVGPQRDLSGKWAEDLTGIRNVHIAGEHLQMPGYSENAPTLEIFSYDIFPSDISSADTSSVKIPSAESPAGGRKQINSYGFSHIAFEVDNVADTAQLLLDNGGSLLGKIVTKDYGAAGIGTFAYAKDIEGNIIELQNWRK